MITDAIREQIIQLYPSSVFRQEYNMHLDSVRSFISPPLNTVHIRASVLLPWNPSATSDKPELQDDLEQWIRGIAQRSVRRFRRLRIEIRFVGDPALGESARQGQTAKIENSHSPDAEEQDPSR